MSETATRLTRPIQLHHNHTMRPSEALALHRTRIREIALSHRVSDVRVLTLQDISVRTSLLSDISKDARELGSCRSAILALKKATTATHFEDEHDGPLEPNSQQIQSIAADGLRVKRCFLKLKHRQFPTE